MTSRWARFVRGQVVAVFATFTAAFSHGAADGAHPPMVAIALALAFSSVACVLLAAAQLSRARLAASVSVSQLLYHGLFSLFGTAGQPSGVITSGHHGVTAISPGISDGVTVVAADPWMLIAHAAAAVLTFAILLQGERALSGIGSLARLIVASLSWWRLPQSPHPVLHQTRFPTGQRIAVPHRSLILTSSLSHRGPPAQLRFA
jgi:hypothetical protein